MRGVGWCCGEKNLFRMSDMSITYTASEARARFSEVMRQVREGKTVTVSYRGDPVAEIRPLEKRKQTLEERIRELELRGVIVGPRKKRTPFRLGERVPGALERFLAERD